MDEVQTLIMGAARLGVALAAPQAQQMLTLLDELERWGRSYNLTSISARHDLITHHLLDSLAVAPWLTGVRTIDVGTGAGFPGLPLAIVKPAHAFTLLDSNGKKVRFVAHAARVLDLANVTPVHARAESYEPPAPGFDCVVARAFAPLPQLIEQVAGLCAPHTRVLALKGRRLAEERSGLPSGWRIEADQTLEIPGLPEERHLVVLRPPVS